jgi:hypothetical protein
LLPILSSLASNEGVKVMQFIPCYQPPSLESSAAIQPLLEPTSSIEGFEFFGNRFTTLADFVALMTAVEKSPLEHFCIKPIDTDEKCHALIRTILEASSVPD